MRQSCYMCDAEATSTEHAPPRCFFPVVDSTGKDLRRNLVTVPSCDLHNSAKSKDDEYLRAVILLASGAQSVVAKAHFFDKVLRAAARRPHAHLAFVRPIGIKLNSGEMCEIDLERFTGGIAAIGAAVYFHRYGERLTSQLNVISPNLFATGSNGVQVPKQNRDAIAATRDFLASEPVLGENPEVFLYRAGRDVGRGIYAFAARFYENFEVFAATVIE